MFDTNILISGYLWKGATRRALDRVRSGQWTLLRSQATVEEFIRVLAYEKFGLQPTEIQPFIADLHQISEFVQVRSDVRVIKEDPTDNIFLNLAVDGAADVVVSGDRHLLKLKEVESIPILSVRSFLLRTAS
ncbi:MAG: putative toxin-antitoxin system toxin component, PIN family [Candidatus Binatia bacterium]